MWHVSGGVCERRSLGLRLDWNPDLVSTLPDLHHYHCQKGIYPHSWEIYVCVVRNNA
jgi:hypothetical protein